MFIKVTLYEQCGGDTRDLNLNCTVKFTEVNTTQMEKKTLAIFRDRVDGSK